MRRCPAQSHVGQQDSEIESASGCAADPQRRVRRSSLASFLSINKLKHLVHAAILSSNARCDSLGVLRKPSRSDVAIVKARKRPTAMISQVIGVEGGSDNEQKASSL